MQSLKFKDTISALLLYELAVKYAVIFARGMLCIPWRFFCTEEHFRLLNSLFRLCLIRPFNSSTSAWQPFQVSACWEQITATVFSARGATFALSALTRCPSSPFPDSKHKRSALKGWGVKKLNSVLLHILAEKAELLVMEQGGFVVLPWLWLQLWCPRKIGGLPLRHILQW